MKKLSKILVLSMLMLIFVTSCGEKEEAATVAITEGTVTEAVTEETATEAETTEAVTEEVVDSDTEGVTESEEDSMGAAVIYYQGHASMRITTPEGKTIYVDPFMGDGYDVPADLILITHGHSDHTRTDLIKSKNSECETITWKEAIVDGEHQTFDLGYVKVEAVEAGYNKNHDVSNCVGYILTFTDGKNLYLSGDTSTTPQMKELADRKLDYAFFCCDGVYNMDMAEAIECAKTVGAKHSIPYHMVPSSNSAGFDQAVAESFDVPDRIILAPGETLELQ